MKTTATTTREELVNYSKLDLIDLIASIEKEFLEKSERLKTTTSKLANARIKLKTQQKKLLYLRTRVVQLTPDTSVKSL